MNATVVGALIAALAGGAAVPCAGSQRPEPPHPVRIVQPPACSVRAGASDTAWVRIEIARGLHVQAHPAATEFLVPLELSLAPAAGLVTGRVVYPRGTLLALDEGHDALLTYDGAVTLAVPVTAAACAAAGVTVLRGTLRYQACDAVRCFAPDELPIALEVEVTR